MQRARCRPNRLEGAVPELRPQDMADIVAFLYAARYFKQGGDRATA